MNLSATSPDPPVEPPNDPDVLDEVEMDETLDDTFPASDPPSWTLGVDESRRKPDDDEK